MAILKSLGEVQTKNKFDFTSTKKLKICNLLVTDLLLMKAKYISKIVITIKNYKTFYVSLFVIEEIKKNYNH